MSYVNQLNKQIGIIYVYESVSYWGKEKETASFQKETGQNIPQSPVSAKDTIFLRN